MQNCWPIKHAFHKLSIQYTQHQFIHPTNEVNGHSKAQQSKKPRKDYYCRELLPPSDAPWVISRVVGASELALSDRDVSSRLSFSGTLSSLTLRRFWLARFRTPFRADTEKWWWYSCGLPTEQNKCLMRGLGEATSSDRYTSENHPGLIVRSGGGICVAYKQN